MLNFTWIAANTTSIAVVATPAAQRFGVSQEVFFLTSLTVLTTAMSFGTLLLAPIGENVSVNLFFD